jgi:pimeloyl-ACP methyl ester carboxylesterase
MAVWQDGTVETNGVRLHYTRTGGDKTPIVLSHGLTDNGLAWSRLAHVLEQTYDLIMVDARGHGLSDKPETGYTPQDHMRDLAGVIRELGLQKPILMGHSMGAITSSMVCAEYPELVRAAILEDPPWHWPTAANQSTNEKRKAYENWRTRLEMRKMLTTAESFARGPRERPLWSAEDHDADVPAKEQVAMQVLEFILYNEQAWAQEVAKYQAPVLLIYGSSALGGVVGPDVAAEARRINSLVEPVQIPTAGHSIRREQFDEYVAVVREFLADVQRGVTIS